jgi:hypothetical protein
MDGAAAARTGYPGWRRQRWFPGRTACGRGLTIRERAAAIDDDNGRGARWPQSRATALPTLVGGMLRMRGARPPRSLPERSGITTAEQRRMSDHNSNITVPALGHIPVEELEAVSGGRGRRAQFNAAALNELTSATSNTIKSIGEATHSAARKQ